MASRSDRRAGSARAAQWYLRVWGAALVVLGAGSLAVHPDFEVGHHVTHERLFGLFETNGWHGLAGLSAGVVALGFARSVRWAPTVAIAIGLLGGVVPAFAFFAAGDGGVALNIIPVDVADAVSLHLVPGLLGLGCGWWASRRSTPLPTLTSRGTPVTGVR